MFTVIKNTIVIAVAILLCSCGGGGGGGGSSPKTYTVSASAGTGGSISPSSASVPSGSTTTLQVTTTEGYEIADVSGCSGSLSNNSYVTGPITANCAVTASFRLKKYTVSTTVNTGGTIAPASSIVEHGSKTTFNILPAAGYKLATVSGCGGTLSGTSYTTTSITGSCTVAATFTLESYAVTTEAADGISFSPTSATVVNGNTATFTIVRGDSALLESVTGCSGTLVRNVFTTGPITAPCVIKSVTKPVTGYVSYALTAGSFMESDRLGSLQLPDIGGAGANYSLDKDAVFGNFTINAAGVFSYRTSSTITNADETVIVRTKNKAGDTIGLSLRFLTYGADKAPINEKYLTDPTSYTTGLGPFYVDFGLVTADFNRDGYADIAVLNPAEGTFQAGDGQPTVNIYFGSKNGALTLNQEISVRQRGANPRSIVLADLNNDGYQDILVFSLDQKITTLLGTSTGSFVSGETISMGGSTATGVVANFDKDTIPDIVSTASSTSGDTVALLRGTSSGFSKSTPEIISGSRGSPGGSFKNPKTNSFDLLSSDWSDSSRIYRYSNSGAGIFTTTKIANSLGAGGQSFTTADLDLDGYPDVILVNYYSNSATIFFGSANGELSAPYVITDVATNPTSVSVSDINGDKIPDLLFSGNEAYSLYLGIGKRFFVKRSFDARDYARHTAIFADINGDGTPEMVVLRSGSPRNSLLIYSTTKP